MAAPEYGAPTPPRLTGALGAAHLSAALITPEPWVSASMRTHGWLLATLLYLGTIGVVLQDTYAGPQRVLRIALLLVFPAAGLLAAFLFRRVP